MDTTLANQARFWAGCLTSVSTQAGTPLTELKKMDVFEFFSLLSVVEERNSKK